MQQLFCGGKPTEMFFNEYNTINEIAAWVGQRLTVNDNIFNLNEKWSCDVVDISNDEFYIEGDEDYVEFTLKTIIPIDI